MAKLALHYASKLKVVGDPMIFFIVTGVVGVLGVLMFLAGVRRMGALRFVSGGGQALGGAALTGGALASGLIGLNLQTYHRLTAEQSVAHVSFAEIQDNVFDVTVLLEPASEREEPKQLIYQLEGDTWQIGARIVKFSDWATVSGADAIYRLDYIEGRFADVDRHNRERPRTERLADNPGLDVYAFADKRLKGVKAIDVSYGGASYQPMADGAEYTVTLNNQGALIARPDNRAATLAVDAVQ